MRQNTFFLKSLEGKIYVSFILIVALSVISFMFISIDQTNITMQDTSTQYTYQLIDMVNENIESYIDNMENLGKIVVNDPDVSNYLFSDANQNTIQNVYGSRVEQEFQTLRQTRDDIYNIGVISGTGRYLINDKDTQLNPYASWDSMDWYTKALAGEEVITSSHVQNIVYNEYPWVVTVSECIPNETTGGTNGVFFVDLNYLSISKLCEDINLGEKGYVFILDQNGNLVFHPKQQLIYSGLWEEDFAEIQNTDATTLLSKDHTKTYTISKSDSTGWIVVGTTYQTDTLSGTEKIKRMYLLLAIILIGVAMLLALFLADRITMPLRKLRESMQMVETGNFWVEMAETKAKDEIDVLIHAFNVMIQKIRQLIETNNQEQAEKRLSELNALQAQINPHFLYNTLDSIIWMAEDGKNKDVVLMTSSLAKLLQKSISNKKELVSVKEEMDYTRSYLTIQKMRYKDKLEYEVEIDPVIQDREIIKLIVQPLVENAIYHGIKPRETGGMVQVKAYYEKEEIIIRVMDDGVGMTKEQLEHIFDERKMSPSRKGLGVQNVQSRIQLYYGKSYGITYASIEQQGTIATIHIPADVYS